MSIQNPYNQNYNYQNQPNQQVVYTKFVNSEEEARNAIPVPQIGCTFGIDGNNMVLYAKYADGHMEIYDMIQREPPKQPTPITEETFTTLLDQKLTQYFNEFENSLSKKFVLRKDNYNRGGTNNGQ